MDDRPVIEFDVRTPLDDETLRRNVIHALSLGLTEAHPAKFPRSQPHLKVIAGGPSARQAPLDGATLTVNNALQLFTDAGKAPTYWAGCDPQAHLADFLHDAPANTIYLVCSKCDPSVFEALRDRKVILWHIDDPCVWDLVEHRSPVQTACSITLTSFSLMRMLGYETFETWGWDGCYMDGKHHANDQIHVGNDIEIVVGDKTFQTTTNWALETQDADDKIVGHGHRVTIRGGGMIGAILKYWQSCKSAAMSSGDTFRSGPSEQVNVKTG